MIRAVLRFYDAIKPFLKKISHDNIFAIAGQSAFFLLLSSVPLVMFVVSVLQTLSIPIEWLQDTFGKILTEDAVKVVFNFLNNLYENTLNISLVSIIAALWSASQGLHAITNGLNRVHHTYENRNWFLLRLRAMIYTVIIFIMLLATVLIVVLGSTINAWLSPHLPSLPAVVGVLYSLRYVIVFLYMVFFFAMLYRNLPNLRRERRKKFGLRCQLPGALFCAISWVVLAWAISIYVDDFNGYSIYGGLTRMAVVMVWLYFCMVCLMLGAEFNYFYNKQIDKITLRIFSRKKKKSKANIDLSVK